MYGIIYSRITLVLALFILQIYFAKTAVLDPTLYLYPSPPLLPSSSDTKEKELWTRASRSTELQPNEGSTTESKDTRESSNTEQESMENAETFWPRLRSIDTLKQIHLPVTFSLSGNYGGYSGSGVIGNTYARLTGTSLFNYGKAALAGSGYGTYGSPIRLYGGNEGPTWTGWGNGKWGHYGKG